MASFNFDGLASALAKAEIDFDTVSLKVLLVTATPTRTWLTRSQVTGEVTGTGYVAGGIAQPYTLNALDTINHRQPITLTNIVDGWTNATFTGVVGAVVYVDSGSAATDKLVSYVEFTSVTQPTAGTFSINYSAPIYINA